MKWPYDAQETEQIPKQLVEKYLDTKNQKKMKMVTMIP